MRENKMAMLQVKLLVGALMLLAVWGCERGEGGPCEVTSDCKAGLVCVGDPRGQCEVPGAGQGDGDSGDGDATDAATGDGDGADAATSDGGSDDEDAGL